MEDTIKTLKISVRKFDKSALIEGYYAKTLIGMCMNPSLSDIKALLVILSKI